MNKLSPGFRLILTYWHLRTAGQFDSLGKVVLKILKHKHPQETDIDEKFSPDKIGDVLVNTVRGVHPSMSTDEIIAHIKEWARRIVSDQIALVDPKKRTHGTQTSGSTLLRLYENLRNFVWNVHVKSGIGDPLGREVVLMLKKKFPEAREEIDDAITSEDVASVLMKIVRDNYPKVKADEITVPIENWINDIKGKGESGRIFHLIDPSKPSRGDWKQLLDRLYDNFRSKVSISDPDDDHGQFESFGKSVLELLKKTFPEQAHEIDIPASAIGNNLMKVARREVRNSDQNAMDVVQNYLEKILRTSYDFRAPGKRVNKKTGTRSEGAKDWQHMLARIYSNIRRQGIQDSQQIVRKQESKEKSIDSAFGVREEGSSDKSGGEERIPTDTDSAIGVALDDQVSAKNFFDTISGLVDKLRRSLPEVQRLLFDMIYESVEHGSFEPGIDENMNTSTPFKEYLLSIGRADVIGGRDSKQWSSYVSATRTKLYDSIQNFITDEIKNPKPGETEKQREERENTWDALVEEFFSGTSYGMNEKLNLEKKRSKTDYKKKLDMNARKRFLDKAKSGGELTDKDMKDLEKSQDTLDRLDEYGRLKYIEERRDWTPEEDKRAMELEKELTKRGYDPDGVRPIQEPLGDTDEYAQLLFEEKKRGYDGKIKVLSESDQKRKDQLKRSLIDQDIDPWKVKPYDLARKKFWSTSLLAIAARIANSYHPSF